jgi:hypothetical protein
MTVKTKDGLTIHLEEFHIRCWFMATEIEQARDTLNVVAGIMEMREHAQPKRQRRKDAGQTRAKDPGAQGLLDS